MLDSSMIDRLNAAAVGALTAAMLLTAAVLVAIPQQVEVAPSSDVHVTAVHDGVGVLSASADATDLAFVVTKGQKG
jgi:hypothetical protein